MAHSTDRRRGRGADAGDSRTDEVVASLVRHGLVDPERVDEAHALVSSALSGPTAADTPLRRRLAEVAGYVGGALVVAAAVIFLTEEWATLSTTGRVSTLAVIGLVLFGSAVVVLRTGGGDSGADRRRTVDADGLDLEAREIARGRRHRTAAGATRIVAAGWRRYCGSCSTAASFRSIIDRFEESFDVEVLPSRLAASWFGRRRS